MKSVIEFMRKAIPTLTIQRLKQYLFVVFSLFLFFFYQEQIHDFIQDNLLVGSKFLNAYVIWVLLLTVFLLSYFAIRTIITNKYVPSYNEIFIAIAILFIVGYYKFTSTWGYQSMDFVLFKLPYIFILLLPLFLFLACHYYNVFLSKLFVKRQATNTNEYINDNPIVRVEDDELDADKVAKNLLRILKNERHKNSFTVGLVGPWGNGKSSVINFVKTGFEEDSQQDTIVIHFLPYLNHNENDIINEFFILLSNELGKFSGKVSNQLMTYSKKLTALYKDKNIFDFLDNQITKIESTSANELYNEINERLVEIDKKIIVLVDDLDRLNEKEILQVLKLIRNTANFNNTFFVVAMDKEYVLSRLKANNDILNSNFIDKFFQLEIYLPEIDNSVLRNYFFECLIKSPLATSDGDFENQFIKAMSNQDNLFNDFVKNFRDVKRVVNQIIYDYPIFKKEIDFKDFLNFIYFKLRFPKYMKILSERKANFIYLDTAKGTYNLKKVEANDDVGQMLNRRQLNSFDYLDKYEIYKSKYLEVCKETDLSIDCEDQILLVKTLAYLFGEENTVPDVSSIKNENNFRMLMQQRIFSNYFSQSQFDQLYDDKKLDTSLLISFHAQEKLPQLLNRLKFYSTENELEIKRTLEILVELYDKRETFNLYDQEILLLIEEFTQRQFTVESDQKLTASEFPDWLKTNIFDNEGLSLETRLLLFGFLTTSRIQNANWNISFDYIDAKVIELLTQYMDSFRGNLWRVHQYPVYRIYHTIKVIGDLKSKINEIFIAFWKDHIEFFCAQTTDFTAFSNNRFKISDTTLEFFNSKSEFIAFVKANSDGSKGVDEFLRLFDLLEKTDFAGGLLFEFEDSTLMKEKIETMLQYPGRSTYDEDENMREVFFETNSEDWMVSTVRNLELRKKYPITGFSKEGLHYIMVRVNRKEERAAVANFMNESLSGWGMDTLPTVKLTDVYLGFPVKFGNIFIRIYSIEPKIKNS